jgi:prepilin signal peptidase PulO-like enzyme (type II secretory pathway)
MKMTPKLYVGWGWLLPAVFACCFFSGCARVPAIDVEGSFLPSWMLCLLLGSLVAIATHLYVLRRRLQQRVAPAIIFYPSLAVACACLVWLLFFR